MTDMAHLQAVVRDNPKREREGALCYVQRLCVLSGLIRPEDTAGEPPAGWSSTSEILEAPERWDQR